MAAERPQITSAAAATKEAPGQASEDAALAEAKRSGSKVEVLSLRGESRDVFATPEGVLEAREYLRPVRTRVGGEWRSIDTTLASAGGGMVAPKAASVALAFSGGGDEPLVRMERSGRSLELSWPDPVPAPQLDGDTATYVNLLPDVDLRLTAQPEGFTQLLVVKSAAAAKSPELETLRMQLSAKGMTVEETAEGGLQATDNGAGGAVFEAAAPMMWDSSDGPASASPSAAPAGSEAARTEEAAEEAEPSASESGQLAPVAVEVSADGKELVLTPDAEVLAGPDTVYPVYIDPQWYSPKATAWTMASKYWASSPQWKFNGDPDEGLGYCNWSYCAPHDTKRLFYQLPTSTYAGKTVLEAEFVVRNTWSASCTARGVELWRTKPISSSTTWNSQNASGFWIDHIQSMSFAHGYDGCAAKDAEFNVKAPIQLAADNKWSSVTFGLRASNEDDGLAWKRFSDDAFIRVHYNRPPSQIRMSQLTQDPGGACADPGTPKQVRIVPTLRANDVTDPDKDSVAVQFQGVWDTGDGKGNIARWTSARTTSKASGSDFSITMPSSIPKNRKIGWSVRSWDGAQWSPWSHDGSATTCGMVYDTSVPTGPSITSAQYPASDSEDPNDPWWDGVGRYGTFTIDTSATDAVKYWYGINTDPSSARTITTTGGAAKSLKTMPTKPGLNFITAQAFDAAGNGSEIRTYQFKVRAGQPDRMSWQMDEASGASEASGQGGDWPAQLYGGLRPGAEGVSGTGLGLDGQDDYAATDAPVLNTGKSFSVSVWAKPTAVHADIGSVAVSQAGAHRSAFALYFSHARYGWVFVRHHEDAVDSTGPGAMQSACAAGDTTCMASRLNTWTHLVGVFDNPAQTIKLYVNGELVGTAPFSGPWEGRGGTLLGADNRGGILNSFFIGALDEAQLFDYQLTDAQVTKLAAKQPVDTNRPAKLLFPLDETSDAVSVVGHAQGAPAGLRGGAKPGVSGVSGRAVEFDGVDDYATPGRPIMDTYQSFAVAAWVKLPKDKELRAMSAVSQSGGGGKHGFDLYHSSYGGGWVFNRYASAAPDAPSVLASQQACPSNINCPAARHGEWNHVVGVYDIDASQIRLYVNGVLVATTAFTTPWLATGPVMLGSAADVNGQPVSALKGSIDDVRLYDRAVSDDEVLQLFKQRPTVTGRWTFEQSGGTPVTTPDATGSTNAMTLHGDAAIGEGWVDGGLILDGVDDHAVTATTPVDTSASFTVTGWAQAAAAPDSGTTLLSIPGSAHPAFAVRYEPDPGRWLITTASADNAEAHQTEVQNRQFYEPTDWNHLALVYDGFARRLTLYVNGELDQTVCADDDADGAPDDPTCTNRVSWADNALTYKASQPLWVGGTPTAGDRYWPGVVSDLWIFQGALTETQIEQVKNLPPGRPPTLPGG
ncbi:LamG-like jellyroll fold domain-containing protein [Streptomyces sp. NPDC007861]|uniref:LamG-like jellyroll fold domain-containing protein n=1 Tax=Streptomyces sp. NPDC007861 TaxID=3154893 RepID=UPI00340F56D7